MPYALIDGCYLNVNKAGSDTQLAHSHRAPYGLLLLVLFSYTSPRVALVLGLVSVVFHLPSASPSQTQVEQHLVDGKPMRLLVHRKGSTRAFPPHHPLIPADYQLIGQPVLVGGSMGTSSYVLTGTEEGFKATFGSTCHGAGENEGRSTNSTLPLIHGLFQVIHTRLPPDMPHIALLSPQTPIIL